MTSIDKLRVTLVTVNFAPETTGIGAYTTSLAKGLTQRGFELSVVTAAPHYPAWRVSSRSEWASTEMVDGVHIRRLRSYVPAHPNPLTRTVFELLYGLRFAARSYRDTDTVILVSPALFASALVRLRLRLGRHRPRVVLWLQDRYSAGVKEVAGGAGRLAGGLVHRVESWLARAADDVVVIHDRWVEPIVETLGVKPESIHVVRNWTHVTILPVDVPAARAQLGWGRPGDEVVVLHSGNMGAKQGLENVVEAARLAERQELSIRFVLAGDGNQREHLERLADGCATLEFMGPLPEPEYLRALQAADVLLLNELPGLTQTAVPSKLTSYFASGRPVLAATESGSVSADEVRASGAGVVINPGEPASLLGAAMTLAGFPTDPSSGPEFAARTLSQDAGISTFAALLQQRPVTIHPIFNQKEGARS